MPGKANRDHQTKKAPVGAFCLTHFEFANAMVPLKSLFELVA